MTHSFDALILGGGAAGLMCAIEAGKRGRRVAVLEHADRLRQENPHLRRRTLQFHQSPLPAGKFSLLQSALRQVGVSPLHSPRFHCAR